jgi:hypothetical protein
MVLTGSSRGCADNYFAIAVFRCKTVLFSKFLMLGCTIILLSS